MCNNNNVSVSLREESHLNLKKLITVTCINQFSCCKGQGNKHSVSLDVGMVMVFNATFNNISAISWWSDLLVEETEYPEKTTDRPAASH